MIYRGYEIDKREGGFTWTDERNFTHYHEGVYRVPFATTEAVKESIDAYRRALHND